MVRGVRGSEKFQFCMNFNLIQNIFISSLFTFRNTFKFQKY